LLGVGAALGSPDAEARDDELSGWADRLDAAGVSVGASYTAEYTAVVSGGLDRGGSFRNQFTADAGFDLGRMVGLEGGSAYVQFLSVNPERGGTLDAGDLQVSSNIESDRHLDTVFELWYEQTFFEGSLRLKAGKFDANSEFAFVDVAGGFANSSAGFSPTISVFPSYPDPATAVMVSVTLPTDSGVGVALAYGLFDGALGVDGVRTGSRGPSSFFRDGLSDDWFHIAQGGVAWDDGRLSFGGWWHTGVFDRFDGGTESGTGGAFATWEQTLWDFGGAAEQGRGLTAFAQYGWADGAVGETEHHLGCGLVIGGPFVSRPSDSAGVYATLAALADGAGFQRDELAVDIYYRAQVRDWVFVQPELQVVFNPGGSASVGDAWILGIRTGFEF